MVVVAPSVPFDAVPHAGGLYLLRLTRILEDGADLTVLVPNTPTNRAGVAEPGAPRGTQVVGGGGPRTWRRRAGARALDVLDRRWRRWQPGLPSLPFAAALRRPGPALDALRAADTIDLEWSESIRLAGRVRRLNPDARLLGTFHDVQSQLFSREPAPRRVDRLFWRWAARVARRHERKGVAALDEAWVFSEKDAALLGGAGHIVVVPPPLATGIEQPRADAPPPPPTVLFVANLARAENDAGARWLLTDIWPAVRRQCPDARLRIVGIGASSTLRTLAAGSDEVTLAGYVADLEPEYAAAWAVVVPLLQGAGVKFKTIEALLHGVPTVTTSVGAEGVGGADLFAGLTDDPHGIAAALVHALQAPHDLCERSARALHLTRATYGLDAFTETVRAAYRLDEA